MSWSVSALGKSQAVSKKLADDFSKITYLTGPEAELKEISAKLVLTALDAFVGSHAVQVSASGSASQYGDNKTQSLSISLGPLHGFIE